MRVSKKRLLTTAVMTAGLLVSALPSSAITSYGSEPAPERTEVGALVARYDRDSDPSTPDVVRWVCSGTMIDADTFLTAAHCTTERLENATFYVSLHQDVQAELDRAAAAHPGDLDAIAEAVGVRGVMHRDPAYPGPSSDSHDIAVIEVPAAAMAQRWTFTPATLPTAGLLDTMGAQALEDTDFVAVGYGTQEKDGQVHPGGGTRRKAYPTFDALNNAWLRLAQREAQDDGGTCYGDSGGPNFAVVNGRLTLVAITITGDTVCYATNVVYRMDAPSARAFLASYMTLP